MTNSPLELAFLSVFLLLFTSMLPIFIRSQRLAIYVSFSISAAASLVAVMGGVWTVSAGSAESITIPIGLPDLPFHLRLDPLAGFFITVIGLLAFFVSIYSIDYVKGFLGKRSIIPLVIFYSLFIAGMLLVVLADDAFFFLISWEIMAASSYFLVMFEHENAENRRAAFLYLVVAHIGAIAILLSFGIMAGLAKGFEGFSGYTFDAMRQTEFPHGWAAIASSAGAFGWLWLTPVAYERASYSGPVVFMGILIVVVAAYLLLHTRRTAIRRSSLWDCGFEKMSPRMQYNSASFSMPIRRIFGFLFSIREQVRLTPLAAYTAYPDKLHYHLRIRDRFWNWLYKPVSDSAFWLSRKFGLLQQGRIQVYLIYSFITIIALLLFSK